MEGQEGDEGLSSGFDGEGSVAERVRVVWWGTGEAWVWFEGVWWWGCGGDWEERLMVEDDEEFEEDQSDNDCIPIPRPFLEHCATTETCLDWAWKWVFELGLLLMKILVVLIFFDFVREWILADTRFELWTLNRGLVQALNLGIEIVLLFSFSFFSFLLFFLKCKNKF